MIRRISRGAAAAAALFIAAITPASCGQAILVAPDGSTMQMFVNPDFIAAIENALGKKAVRNYRPMQPGDVAATSADVEDLRRDVGFAPATPIETGIARFIAWYREYYKA